MITLYIVLYVILYLTWGEMVLSAAIGRNGDKKLVMHIGEYIFKLYIVINNYKYACSVRCEDTIQKTEPFHRRLL